MVLRPSPLSLGPLPRPLPRKLRGRGENFDRVSRGAWHAAGGPSPSPAPSPSPGKLRRERGEFDCASAGPRALNLVCTPSPTLFVGEGGRVSARPGEGPTAAEASAP